MGTGKRKVMSHIRKIRRQKKTNNPTSFRQMIEGDMDDSLLATFENATNEEKLMIERDVKTIIKRVTDFKTYEETPKMLRTNLLQKSIGFILFGV